MDAAARYRRCVSEPWLHLLEILDMNRRYVRCEGTRLEAEDRSVVLDFLANAFDRTMESFGRGAGFGEGFLVAKGALAG